MFEPETRAGFKYIILEYVEGHCYPIKIAYTNGLSAGSWFLAAVSINGTGKHSETKLYDLIPIKPEKPVIEQDVDIKALYTDKSNGFKVGVAGCSAIISIVEADGTTWFEVYEGDVIRNKYNAAFIVGVEY